MQVNELSRAEKAVDTQGRPTEKLHLFSVAVAETLANSMPLSGSGSPEGIVESPSNRMYFDMTGAPGSRLYWKTVNDVSGDKSAGWELV